MPRLLPLLATAAVVVIVHSYWIYMLSMSAPKATLLRPFFSSNSNLPNFNAPGRAPPPPPLIPVDELADIRPYLSPGSIEGGKFVHTGDIHDMWIRDSTAQVWPYRDSHPNLIEEVLRQQSFFIQQDVYANSYSKQFREYDSLSKYDLNLGRGHWVSTRNYELDSGAYFLQMLHHR